MKNKIIITILAIFIALIFIAIGVYFCIKNFFFNKKEQIISSNFQNIIEDNNESIKSMIDINLQKSNSWSSGSTYFSQFKITLNNISNENISNWKLDIDIPKNFEITQIWNANHIINENVLTITSTNYNSTISSNSSIEIGFIASCINDFDLDSYTFYKDDTPYKSNEIVNNNSNEIVSDNSNVIVENFSNEANNEITDNFNTPVSLHGNLSVNGTNIVDKNGKIFSLHGVSTHGLAWFPQYVNKQCFKTLRDELGVNTVRLAMYSDPNAGYNKNMHEVVKKGVDIASELGLYVIIDWHVLDDKNPNIYKENAKTFFKEITNLYKDYPNVLYEICNEPNGNVTWEKDIKPYAQEMISLIRSIDNDAIIIVGTPNWCQDVDIVAKNPIKNVSNVMYSLHFYAATHKQDIRDKMLEALDLDLPIFVSEFGICDASGNGNIDEKEANIWIDTLNNHNISWICWNLSNKSETSSLINSSCTNTSSWTLNDLSNSGKWLLQALKNKMV